LLVWILYNLRTLWQEIRHADALHVAVPGIGGVAILLGLLQRKRLFIRHCGTWDQPVTPANHALLWLLEKIGSDNNMVFATGGSDSPPSRNNPHIHWIFSTTLTKAELECIPPAHAWRPGQSLRMITVCRLAEGKNVQSILEAVPLIGEEVTDIHLDILGDGEYRPVLEKLATELRIHDKVTFHGNVDHERVLQELSRSHLFVFPTRVKEGFPKAVLEAQACGLPVVATRVSVIPEMLKNGCGCLLDDTTSQAVAKAVLNLLATPEALPQMGCLAHEAAQDFTLEAWGETIGKRLQAAWGPLRGDPK
jgi:glycosyltransferase involved in cell wall biosynthesis